MRAAAAMNDWPPKPGSTVITRTISNRPRYGARAASGVAGRTASPGRRPAARMARRIGSIGSSISTWIVIESQPAAMNSGMYWVGLAIIR